MPNRLRHNPGLGHIVIVDDSEEVRRSVSLMLRARGYRADTHASGSALLDGWPDPGSNDEPTCYLIDYKLPEGTGIDLLRQMRARGMTAPAFMITGYYSPGLRQKALDVGYDDVIEKPLPTLELLTQIRTAGTG